MCFLRCREHEECQNDSEGHGGCQKTIIQMKQPRYRAILEESAQLSKGNLEPGCSHGDLTLLSSERSTVPFSRTHIIGFKKMIFDTLPRAPNRQQKTFISLSQLQKLCQEGAGTSCVAWQREDLWVTGAGEGEGRKAELVAMLEMYYLPLKKGDELIPLKVLVALGLVLCKGSNYDKAKFLFSFIEDRTGE